jgi:hypothetical protein
MQDAELPSEITDSTNTQPCGLCHNNKSEPGLLLRQPVQCEEEIIQSLPAVNASSQQASHSIQYASANDKQSITSAHTHLKIEWIYSQFPNYLNIQWIFSQFSNGMLGSLSYGKRTVTSSKETFSASKIKLVAQK